MLERQTSDLWQSMQSLNTELALKYVTLAQEILTGKQLAQVEFFPLKVIPGNLPEQAAALLRHALLLDPKCDQAHYYLGILFLKYQIISIMSDALHPDIMWDYTQRGCNAKAAVCLRRALAINFANSHALTALGKMVLNNQTMAQGADFPDGEYNLRSSVAEHAANLFRIARRFNNDLSEPLFELGKLIEVGRISFDYQDYDFESPLDDNHSHAACFYRAALRTSEPIIHTKANLGNLIAAYFIKAEKEDFANGIIPEEVPQQANALFDEVLQVDPNCCLSLLGFAKLIMCGLIQPIEQESSSSNGIASPSEHAATVLRKIIAIDPDNATATICLAELILDQKIKMLPCEKGTLSHFFALEMMVRKIFRTLPDYPPALEFLEKVVAKEKEYEAQSLERARQQRVEREAESARQQEAKLKAQQNKLHAQQQKSVKPVRKAEIIVSSAPSSTLFSPQKKLRSEKEKEIKSSSIPTQSGPATRMV